MVTDLQLTGAELGRSFYTDVVEPLLRRALPGLSYAAARLGSGSDVLGLDDAMSRDHDWGCRLTLLVDDEARDLVPRISAILEDELPERFGEYPVRFPVTWDSLLSHQVEVATVAGFAASRLGVDPSEGLSALDWLTVTGQSVLEVTAGPVFADRTRALAAVRTMLAWYPPDVERYVLAAGWQRLCQLLSRRWAPYGKWRGTVFDSGVIPFFDRPYRTLDGAVPQALLDSITDPEVRRLAPMVGSIEQWVDSVDVLSSPGRRAALRVAYRALSSTR